MKAKHSELEAKKIMIFFPKIFAEVIPVSNLFTWSFNELKGCYFFVCSLRPSRVRLLLGRGSLCLVQKRSVGPLLRIFAMPC